MFLDALDDGSVECSRIVLVHCMYPIWYRDRSTLGSNVASASVRWWNNGIAVFTADQQRRVLNPPNRIQLERRKAGAQDLALTFVASSWTCSFRQSDRRT